MPDSAVMIRARRSTRDALKEIAERRNTSLIDALDQIVRDVREEELIAAVAVSLGEHAHAVALETRALDDATAADGLDPDDDFSGW